MDIAFPGLAGRIVVIGTVSATYQQVSQALDCLRSSRGLMVRQPLARIGSPLAECDYHAVAAPHLHSFADFRHSGRGAAGRHLTKTAFCIALDSHLGEMRAAEPGLYFTSSVADALQAFASDHAYAASIAGAAVTYRRKRYQTGLRQQLRQASHQAVSACEARSGEIQCQALTPCGTGTCLFATGILRQITAESLTGRTKRPSNHCQPGGYSPDDALGALEALVPFSVGYPVSDGDSGRGTEAVSSVAV
jgi:hypothetical protein